MPQFLDNAIVSYAGQDLNVGENLCSLNINVNRLLNIRDVALFTYNLEVMGSSNGLYETLMLNGSFLAHYGDFSNARSEWGYNDVLALFEVMTDYMSPCYIPGSAIVKWREDGSSGPAHKSAALRCLTINKGSSTAEGFILSGQIFKTDMPVYWAFRCNTSGNYTTKNVNLKYLLN